MMKSVSKTSLDILPQHILTQVITHTVKACDPDEALKLRLVSKQLDHEVLHVVFEKDVLRLPSWIVPSDLAVFRYFRGFLLRRECEKSLASLRQRLFDAATCLTICLESNQSSEGFTGSFSKIYPSRTESPSEEAIAALGEVFIQYVGGPKAITRFWASMRSDDTKDSSSDASSVVSFESTSSLGLPETVTEPEEHVENMTDDVVEQDVEPRGPAYDLGLKDVNFWVLATVSYFGNLDLTQTSLNALRKSCEDDSSVTLYMRDVFHMPAQKGHILVIDFLLEQAELTLNFALQGSLLNDMTALEHAIKSEQISMVMHLLSKGWDIGPYMTKFISAIVCAIRYTKDAAVRREFVETLLSLTREWRNPSMINGIFCELFAKGDLSLAEKVLERIQADPDITTQDEWAWTLSDRDMDWEFEDRTAMYIACRTENLELVRLLINNRANLPLSMAEGFRTREIRACMETAIKKNQKFIFEELLKVNQKISRTKLMAYAAMNGNVDTLKLLAPEVDLNSYPKKASRWWFHYDSGSDLVYDFRGLELEKTSFIYDTDNVSVGTFCLVLAIKSLQVENTKYFIDQGIRIGTRLTYIARNFQGTTSLLLNPNSDSDEDNDNDNDTPKKAKNKKSKPLQMGPRAFVVTYQQIYLTDAKSMLNEGARCFGKALVFTKRPNGRPWSWKIRTARVLRTHDARVIASIQVPEMTYDDEPYREMWKLLKKNKLPLLYTDEASSFF